MHHNAQAQVAGTGKLFMLNNRTWRWYIRRASGSSVMTHCKSFFFFSDVLEVWQEYTADANPIRLVSALLESRESTPQSFS